MVLMSIPLGDADEDAAGGVEGDASKPGAEKLCAPASPAAAAGPLGVGGASPKPVAEGVPEGARVAVLEGAGDPLAERWWAVGRGTSEVSERCAARRFRAAAVTFLPVLSSGDAGMMQQRAARRKGRRAAKQDQRVAL